MLRPGVVTDLLADYRRPIPTPPHRDASPHALAELGAPDRRRLALAAGARCVASAAVVVAAYYLAPWGGGDRTRVAIWIVAVVAVVLIAVAVAVRSMMRAERPVLRAAEALATVVALAIVGFAAVYRAISNADPTAFSEPLANTDALYFSLTTATTVGYGDIAARSEPARIAVMVQMIVNVAVIGVAVRLVFSSAKRRSGLS